jgi:hypothetical protein
MKSQGQELDIMIYIHSYEWLHVQAIDLFPSYPISKDYQKGAIE